MSNPSLYTLPIELLHRILDHVDTVTVFLSFRNVCKYFYTIINSYNQQVTAHLKIRLPFSERIASHRYKE